MSESPPYRRNAQKKFIKDLIRQSKNEANLADLRRRITAVYEAETSSDDNEEIHMPIPEINNEDIPSETNRSELSGILSAGSEASNNSLFENENTINGSDVDSELHFEDENSDSDGIAEMDDVNNRCSDHEDNDLMIQFENDEDRSFYALATLREWALEGGVLSMKKLNNLLLRLRVLFPNLPKSYKTLLQTPPILGVQQLPDGSQLWYKVLLFEEFGFGK
ncbi:uncharacterized protein LOC112459317 [Temnothorax curvispinosus]|uniref:Uncharacterized protein LOC112459317 n=1 Tax=Temnothorax curvispinosus TaxID=300111 RepID=A0A6J1QEI2_9HYME|nr:uncharacterized protein LOC112459317 [Temnothorax curvispinosus]